MIEIPNKQKFTVPEAAAIFGVTEKTIYIWIEKGILEAVKIAGLIRIPRESMIKCQAPARKE